MIKGWKNHAVSLISIETFIQCYYIHVSTRGRKNMTGIEKKNLNIAQNISALEFCLASNLTRKNEKLDVYVTFIPMWIHHDFRCQICKTLQEISYAFSKTSLKFI